MSLAHYHKHYKYSKRSARTELMQFLLVISGNVELNLGLWIPKYLCGECGNAVTINSIACDICSTWYYCECAGMNLTIFESYAKNSKMEWECAQCAMSNISSSIFDSTISSSYSSNTDSEEIIPKSKAKSLRTVTLNFQSMFNKKEICQFLNDNHSNIILGCETHLSRSVSTSELLPLYIQHTGVTKMIVMEGPSLLQRKIWLLRKLKQNKWIQISWLLSRLSLSLNMSY